MNKSKKYYFILVILLLLWLTFSLIYIFYNFNRAHENKELRVLKIAKTAEVSMLGSSIRDLNALPSDVNTESYLSLKKRLKEFSNIDEDIVFAYFLTQKNGDIYFLVDSEEIGSEDYSAPGDLFFEADSQVYEVFEKKEAMITEPAVDRWGTWISVLVPMLDDNGELIAVFGIDYSADNWYSEAYASIYSSTFTSFIFLILIIFLYLIDKNRRQFKKVSFNYKRLTDNISDVVWSSDLFFNLRYISPSIINLTGETADEYIKKDLSEKFTLDSVRIIKSKLKEELKNEKKKNVDKDRVIVLELEHYKKDKSIFLAEMSVKFIRDENARAIGIQGLTRDITEKRKILEELKDSEEKFRLISENSPVVVFQFVPTKLGDGYFNYISSQAKKVTGFTRSEFLKNYSLVHERILPNYIKDFDKAIEQAIKTNKGFKFVLEFRKKDDSIVWLDFKFSVSKLKDKTKVLNGVFIDISKQKEFENKLIVEKDRLNHIIEGASVGTWETNLKTKEIIINQKWAEILGYSLNELKPFTIDKWLDLTHPDDLAELNNEFSNHLEGKTDYFEHEYRMKHKNGDWFWVYGKGKAVLFDKKNKPIGMFGTFMGINERKKQEENLLKITKSVEQGPTSIVITDVKGNIEYVNPKFEKLTGYSLSEAIGKNPRILKSGKTSLKEYKELWSTITKGKDWHGEFYNKKKNGDFFWEAASISAVFDKKGKIINYIAVKEDITKQKKIQDDLEKSQEKFKGLVENIPGATFRCKIDKHWTMIYISDFIKKITGYKASDYINNKKISFNDVILAEDRDYVAKEINKAVLRSSNYELEYRIKKKNGEIKWVKDKARIIKDKEGAKYLDGIIYDINTQKEAADLIKLSKKRYDDLAKQSKTYVWEVDKDANYIYVSENVKDVIGYSQDEIINKKTVFDLHPKEGREEFKKNVLKVLRKKEKIQSLENPILAKDGTIVWVTSSGMPVLDKSGKMMKFVGTDMDISAKKKIDDKVKSNLIQQEFLSKITSKLSQYTDYHKTINLVLKEIAEFTKADRIYIFEDSADGQYTSNTYEYTAKGIKAEINNLQKIAWQNFKKMYKELRENNIFKVDDVNKLPKAEREYLKKQKIKSILCLPLKISGKMIGFMGLDIVLKQKNWNSDDIYLMEIISKSISSVIEKEKNLKDIILALNEIKTEKEKIETIVEGIGDGVFVLNKDLEVILFNNQAINISGFSRDEVIGQKYYKILKFIDEISGKKNDKFITEAFESGKVQKMTNHTMLIRKDGQKVAVADSSAPIYNKNNEIVACVVVFRDVSYEREIDRVKSEFVSVVSHQLKTPLTGIKWMSELLLEADFGKVNKEQKEFIDTIYSSNERMIKLVNDLLHVSHIETGRKFDIKKEKTDIVKIVTQVLMDNMQLAKEKNIRIVKCEGAPKKLVMKVDKSKIEQVFANLINNAIKYSKNNSQVKISCEHKKKEIIFEIKDEGIGIPKDQQAKIATKFFRARNALNSHTDGTGLGLYISRSIVQAHGGKLWFESEKNKGTSFYFSLPN